MGLALDEPNENDDVFENGGFTFIIEKKLLQEAEHVEVDYLVTAQGEGFVINSGLKKGSDCGGCTSC